MSRHVMMAGLLLASVSAVAGACSEKTVVPLGIQAGSCIDLVDSDAGTSMVERACEEAAYRVVHSEYATDRIPDAASDICDRGLDLVTLWVIEDPARPEDRAIIHYCLDELR